jgi:hypothetical protein
MRPCAEVQDCCPFYKRRTNSSTSSSLSLTSIAGMTSSTNPILMQNRAKLVSQLRSPRKSTMRSQLSKKSENILDNSAVDLIDLTCVKIWNNA